jgi:dihydroneopterin aldolase
MNPERANPNAQTGDAAGFDPSADHQRVFLRDIEVAVKVGVHPWEKHPERPSRLLVSVELFAALGDRGTHTGASLIDYDRIRDAIRTWPTRPHVAYLETLAEEAVALCFENARVVACRVTIAKPDIFNDVAAVGVEMFRRRPA